MSQQERLSRLTKGPAAYGPIPLITERVADISDATEFPEMHDAYIYNALKAYGHSPFKAAEIALDARRGDPFSVKYVAFVLSTQHNDTANGG